MLLNYIIIIKLIINYHITILVQLMIVFQENLFGVQFGELENV